MTVCGIKHADGVCVMGECPHFKTCCPVVWDKSGEPMTKEIKIRCDDCKFVEDCVDYGWDGCKKFTSKPSEPMTNEEWFISLPTEEKAKFIFWQHFDVYGKTLYELMVNASRGVSRDKQAEVMIGAVVGWLKEKHE